MSRHSRRPLDCQPYPFSLYASITATVRYLAAYSPDLNPIEMAFSKLKAALRKGAKRTVKELWRLIGKLVKSFVPDQCANYFRHAGYRR